MPNVVYICKPFGEIQGALFFLLGLAQMFSIFASNNYIMISLAKEMVKQGHAMQVDELVVLEHAVIAFALDPDRITLEGEYYISLSHKYVTKYNDAIARIVPVRYSNCIATLVRLGFLDKKIHADTAYYKASAQLQALCGMSFMQVQVVVDKKEATGKTATKPPIEERRNKFINEAKTQFDLWNVKAVAFPDRSSLSAFPLTAEHLKDFVQYWTAPMQKKNDRMLFEDQATFAFQQRIRTAIEMKFSKAIPAYNK